MKKIFQTPKAELVEVNMIENILQSSNTTTMGIDTSGTKISEESGITPEARSGVISNGAPWDLDVVDF